MAPACCYPATTLVSLMAELRRQIREHMENGDLARASEIADFAMDTMSNEHNGNVPNALRHPGNP